MDGKIEKTMTFGIASPFRLQWEDAQDSYVLLYPEGMISLNTSAGEVLQLCDRTSTVSEIITKLVEKFQGANIEADVLEFLEIALAKGWISE